MKYVEKKLKENLTTYQDDAFMSKELVTINCHSPIEVGIDDLTYEGYDSNQIIGFFKELGFQSLLERMGEEIETDIELDKVEFTMVDEITSDMFSGKEALFLEMLEDNYHKEPIIGIGIVNKGQAYFVSPEDAFASQAFREWIEDETKKKIVFDAKKTAVALKKRRASVKRYFF